jgi:hypothetical protein
MSPDDALVKAANDNHLNPHMTRRAIEGFNIAKTNATIAKATDKTASFPIANADSILSRVFTKGIEGEESESKTAGLESEDLQEIVHSFELSFVGNDKVASHETSLADASRQALGYQRTLDAQLSKLAQDILSHENAMTEAMTDLQTIFSLSDSRGKFAQFEGEVLSEYGEAARPTLDIIYGLSAHQDGRYRGLMPKVGSLYFESGPEHRAFDRLMSHTDKYIEAVKDREACQADAKQKTAELRDMLFEASGLTAPTAPVVEAADLLGFPKGASKEDAPSDPLEAFALSKEGILGMEISPIHTPTNVLLDAAQSGVSKGISDQYGKAHTKAIEDGLRGPKDEVDLEMENVRRKAILRDLMTNDEIIGKQDPQHIEGAYNTLLRLAPDLTLHHAVVQSFLRSAGSQQVVDPFTATQLAELQGQVAKNKLMSKGALPPAK